MSIKSVAVWSIAAVVIAAVIWFNYVNLDEAYGAGPPYYGRTTNMDKWANPIPILAVVDVIAGLLIALLFKFGLRGAKR
jgi:hypothetical protein